MFVRSQHRDIISLSYAGSECPGKTISLPSKITQNREEGQGATPLKFNVAERLSEKSCSCRKIFV